ncbi:hypothetical protein CG736_08730 [Kitasatospora sp. CB02891]|nr:hypothetical protein CG736_08730 [Kitasatospora sp. CB02891]
MPVATATAVPAPSNRTVQAVPAAAATAPRSVDEPHCAGEWIDSNSDDTREMKSWLCMYDAGDSRNVYAGLWTECRWWKIIGWAAPPNGCRIWEPSSYKLTAPDGTVYEGTFPGASGSSSAASESSRVPCQDGAWKVWSYYGVQMKDVLGNWGSSVAGIHEGTFTVHCP